MTSCASGLGEPLMPREGFESHANQVIARRSLVIGLGVSGLSIARFMQRQGAEFAVMDSREQPPGLDALHELAPDTGLFLGDFSRANSAAALEHAEQLIVSPGVDLATPAIAACIAAGTPVLGDIELFALFANAPVVAITGSNGKSTVTTLLAEMIAGVGMQVRAGGNLGTPALDLLQDAAPDFYVLELSSFQLETTTHLQAACAVVLNLSADHMDRYSSYDAYVETKERIYDGALVAVVNRDDPAAARLVKARAEGQVDGLECDGQRPVLSFGSDGAQGDHFGLCEGRWGAGAVDTAAETEPCICQGEHCLIPLSRLRLPGGHNVSNVMAALTLGEAIGLPLSASLHSIESFKGLAHRTEWVAELDGVAWYNDSKGTNVGATVAAIEGIDAPIVLIAGGMGKGADFTHLGDAASRSVKLALLIGEDAELIDRAIAGRIEVRRCDSLEEAVQQAAAVANEGEVVLFSPACASFDMFENFEHRGQRFVAAVHALAKRDGGLDEEVSQ